MGEAKPIGGRGGLSWFPQNIFLRGILKRVQIVYTVVQNTSKIHIE